MSPEARESEVLSSFNSLRVEDAAIMSSLPLQDRPAFGIFRANLQRIWLTACHDLHNTAEISIDRFEACRLRQKTRQYTPANDDTTKRQCKLYQEIVRFIVSLGRAHRLLGKVCQSESRCFARISQNIGILIRVLVGILHALDKFMTKDSRFLQRGEAKTGKPS
jgi:hypothetical protein